MQHRLRQLPIASGKRGGRAPYRPIHSSDKLADLATFKSHIRNPALAGGGQSLMPAFSPDRLSDADAAKLFDYIRLYLAKPDCQPQKPIAGPGKA